MEVAQAIDLKRAVRQFDPRPISQETLHHIIHAGRRAQSAKNTQPWHFIAIQDKNILRQLSELGTYAGHLAGAAVGVAILTPDPNQRWSIMFDAGQAAAYMQLAAWELNIGSCLATIYEPDRARQLLGFPEDLYLNVAISFGHPSDPSVLTRPLKSGGRRAVDEVLHLNRWDGQ
ncbi:MAG: nitroreductase family protein [Anaerolineales bacterium]|jgi:nitroreductase